MLLWKCYTRAVLQNGYYSSHFEMNLIHIHPQFLDTWKHPLTEYLNTPSVPNSTVSHSFSFLLHSPPLFLISSFIHPFLNLCDKSSPDQITLLSWCLLLPNLSQYVDPAAPSVCVHSVQNHEAFLCGSHNDSRRKTKHNTRRTNFLFNSNTCLLPVPRQIQGKIT